MRRRSFNAALAHAAWAQPLVARAQPAEKVFRIGFLGANTPAAAGHLTAAFLARMRELGWVENQHFVIEYRWAAGQAEGFRAAAAELVAARVDVIVTSGNLPAIITKQATASIPIVMASSGDAVGTGIIQSLAHPGGNVTGLTFSPEDTAGKRLELLKETVPRLTGVGLLANPQANTGELVACREAAPRLGLSLHAFAFREPADLAHIAASPRRNEIGALYVASDPLLFTNRVAIGEFAIVHKLPTVHRLREYAVDGGLMSYGTSFIEFFRRSAEYVDKILKGKKPADLPVEQPTKFEFVVNLKTARALGLKIPQPVLLRADEVIE